MPDRQAEINGVAAHIADGAPIDWTSISTGGDDLERRILDNLKVVAHVASLHSSPSLLSSLTSGSLAQLGDGPDAVPLSGGSMWGHLKILECVGRGRFGVVYRAFDTTLEREVALKLLNKRFDANGAAIAHEGRMMARVHHPNVVTVYGAQVIDDDIGIWMQFIGGQTLEAELRAAGRFDAAEIIRVGVDLCEALNAVHAVGLVHRDVKAANVMRDASGRIVLGDFGTGQLIADARSGMVGTPLYLAPEVIAGAPATPQSDIYSLGVLLFHLATGDYPVSGRSLRELRDAHASARKSSLGTLRPDLPEDLARAIDGAIASNPAARWTSAGDFHANLAASRASEASRVEGFATRLPRLSRKTASFFAIAAVATVVLVSSAATPPRPREASSALGDTAVTTRSMRALRLYTVAAGMMQGIAPWPEAEVQRFLREALEEDPDFASARILLAHSLNNQNRPIDEVMAEATRALEGSSLCSEAERAFIEGSFFGFRGEADTDLVQRRLDLERAATAYERLLTVAPKHSWVYTNLANVYSLLHRDADVLKLALLQSQNRPGRGAYQARVALEYYCDGAFENAAPFITRARELFRSGSEAAEFPFVAAWLSFAEAHHSWMADSVTEALRVVEATNPPASNNTAVTVFLRQKVAFYLTLGRLDDAERASIDAPSAAERDDLLLSVLAYRNDRDRMSELLARRPTSSVFSAILLPIPPDIFSPSLHKLLAEKPPRLLKTRTERFVAARAALADARVDEAIDMVEKFEPFRSERGRTYRMLMALTLADAWMTKGDSSRAIAELQPATEMRSAATCGASTGALWILTRARLAELYRQSGQTAKALPIEEHLRKLLRVADDDHPIKKRLNELRSEATR